MEVKQMILLIVDNIKDSFNNKKYPYPMLLLEEDDKKIIVDNRGYKEILRKDDSTIKINKLSIKKSK